MMADHDSTTSGQQAPENKIETPAPRDRTLWQRLYHAKMQHGWQWLIYLDVIFPVLLFALARLPITGLQRNMALMFHTYGLYVLSPFPDFVTFTGILAPLLHLFFILRAAYRRKIHDLLLCLFLFGVLVLYFYLRIDGTALNYYVLRFLDFGLSGF